jgi:hypothetical protein
MQTLSPLMFPNSFFFPPPSLNQAQRKNKHWIHKIFNPKTPRDRDERWERERERGKGERWEREREREREREAYVFGIKGKKKVKVKKCYFNYISKK